MTYKINHRSIIFPGAYKSGTSTLFDLLIKHSLIDNPEINRSQFFALEEDVVRENIEWYKEKHYPEKKRMLHVG